MRRSPMPPPDPEQIRAWQARSEPLHRNRPLRPVSVPERWEGRRETRLKLIRGDGATVTPLPARKPLKPVSAKRARENRERAAMADRLYPDRREGTVTCAVPRCGRPADDLHEPLTRARGGSITDEDNTKPVCRQHNDELTLEPAWGYELGFLKHSWHGNNGGNDAA